MAHKIPTLSTVGLIGDAAKKADTLMAYFFSSDTLQSNLYRSGVKSLASILQETGQNQNAQRDAIRAALDSLYASVFDRVTVNVTINVDQTTSVSDIRVDILVYQDGKQYSVGRLIQAIDSKVQKIFNLNNG